ncbi:MAG: hypothetical protein PHG23_00585 [Candidatus Pacebacteria bacterium]|nr:hypothetical protein [Candidatus Paceibacterota bacterium]
MDKQQSLPPKPGVGAALKINVWQPGCQTLPNIERAGIFKEMFEK